MLLIPLQGTERPEPDPKCLLEKDREHCSENSSETKRVQSDPVQWCSHLGRGAESHSPDQICSHLAATVIISCCLQGGTAVPEQGHIIQPMVSQTLNSHWGRDQCIWAQTFLHLSFGLDSEYEWDIAHTPHTLLRHRRGLGCTQLNSTKQRRLLGLTMPNPKSQYFCSSKLFVCFFFLSKKFYIYI